ncbi:interleukin-17 receptor E isoform X1 [Canis lupus familiaris]|uniref:interleukin-17 receptor E isoform X1 n=1 Tax=Canis lupus familiaris TaxID=9615 RepID=UPI0018F49899|nr:interleukin-17 receptor E isoform X1 [Canis lupus familiaris]XP_038421610.1 interleukin-17 receptor E isoform X1 [Canis lupus familiaris]
MMGRVPTKPGASSASETTGNQQGSAAHLQAVQPCPGHSDPTEAHGEPQTGSPVPPSSPAVYWPLCLRQDWPLLPAPLEHPLSAGLPHGKEDTLTGRSACIPCHTQLALPVSLKPWCVQLWLCPYYLCLHLVSDPSGLRGGWFYLLVQKYKKSHKFRFCRRHKMPAYAQRKLMSSCCLSEKGHHIAVPSPDISHKGLRSKRTQPADPKAVEDLPRPSSQRHEGPEFSFDLLSEARAIQVTIPPGPEVSVRLCHQWVLECEELSSPFDTQKIVSGGHAVDLPYEFLLPCLCIEASYLQEDTVRRKKCPFQNWPEAYGSDFWKSVHFTDYSQHSQMVMALTLRCPLKLQASLCQRQNWHTFCEDLPNATAQEAEGWYVLEGVDLHPQLCFKFSFRNSSHVECPHRTAPSWNVSMDTQAQQLVLHFSSRIHATFSAAWSHPSLGQDGFVPPVYSISQTQGSSPVTLDLIIPFLKPGSCVLVWRSDVQFSWKHLLCPDVSHRHLGLLILAILALATLLGIVLALTRRRPLSGPGGARPVLLLHAADSEAQRLLVGALAELLRAALGGGRDVIVDLWEGTRVARVGPLPWLWAARARVAQEQGTVLLLWSSAGPSPARGPDPRSAPLRALLRAAPRPLLLLAYFSRLCAKGDIPQPLRALPRYRLLRDLPRLLRALDAQPSTEATGRGRLGDRQCLRGRLELCHRLEREAAKLCPPRLSRDRRRGTGWNP